MSTIHNLGNQKPYFKNYWKIPRKEIENFSCSKKISLLKKENFSSFSRASKRDIYSNSIIDKKVYEVCWEKARDRQDIRLATKDKVPQYWKESYWPTIKEKRRVQELITKYGEWGHRTGKRIGNYWDIRVDFDFYHKGTPLVIGRHWEGSFIKMTDWLKVKYDKTQHGVQVNLLLKELPSNCSLYHIDKYGKKRIVGSILSIGRQAQGLGSPHKEPAGEGKWALKAQNIQEVAELFSKFFFMIDYEAKMNRIRTELKENQVSNRKVSEVKKGAKKTNESEFLFLAKKASQIKGKKTVIRWAQILKKHLLPFKSKDGGNIYKFWYQQKENVPRYFLLDTYQKHREMVLDRLPVGSFNNFVLNQGQVYQFFYGFG